MAKYTYEKATLDAQAIYKTASGRAFFNFLMNEARLGMPIRESDEREEQKALGAHNFIAEQLSERITRKPKSGGKNGK
jgi:hypothetical protein